MSTVKKQIDSWPADLQGKPALKSTNDAIVYATLIYTWPNYIHELKLDQIQNLNQIGMIRSTDPFDLTKLSGLAIQGQYLRECIQEVERLQNKNFELNNFEHFPGEQILS